MASPNQAVRLAGEDIADGILDFMVRSRGWSENNNYWHVRQLCEDRVVENTCPPNAVSMLHFADQCHSHRVRERARSVLLSSFEHVFEQPDMIEQLTFLQLKHLVSSPDLRVQTESHVCDAIVKWLQQIHGSRISSGLAEREDLRRQLAETIPPLEREDQVYHTIEGDVQGLSAEVKRQELAVNTLKLELGEMDQELSQLDYDLLAADKTMLDAARELAGYSSQEILLTVYRNAKPRVERVLTCVAILLGLDPVWDITQRMCYEDKLIPKLLQYDYHVVEPAQVGDVFKILSKPSVNPGAMTTKPARAIAFWAHAASKCVQLSTDIVNGRAERGRIAEELRVAGDKLAGMREDLEGLRALEANSTERYVGAMETQMMAQLRVDLCEARLRRNAAKLDADARALLELVRWPLVAKPYIHGDLLQHPFVACFLPPGSQAGGVLERAALVPLTDFLRMAASEGGGQRDVYGAKGRRLTGENGRVVAQVWSEGARAEARPRSGMGWQGLTFE
eukprot:CAMPEP_0177690254 /NCGR_PEP_ID=MMETSP0484_2-20121128/663_1 /TAXON_ID=354590 /ORGANISM="Rhodomonas lens, Strain RHODO" /LENGTH=507 /DNA_ID=CAMNT_0019200775 /DNA_START=67 /DNA_END=1587 /DNA_ORIENTATION=-